MTAKLLIFILLASLDCSMTLRVWKTVRIKSRTAALPRTSEKCSSDNKDNAGNCILANDQVSPDYVFNRSSIIQRVKATILNFSRSNETTEQSSSKGKEAVNPSKIMLVKFSNITSENYNLSSLTANQILNLTESSKTNDSKSFVFIYFKYKMTPERIKAVPLCLYKMRLQRLEKEEQIRQFYIRKLKRGY
ncbi:hypothetical protein ACOME3_010790 [Neoechinorhynchus agilis]